MPAVCAALVGFVIVFVFVQPLYDQWHERAPKQARTLFLKALGVLIAASFACWGAAARGGSAWFIAAGLIVCALADVLLELRFIAGMVCFGVGHILYITGFALGCRAFPVAAAALFAVVYALGAIYITKLKDAFGAPLPCSLLYAALLTGSMVMGLTAPLRVGLAGLPFAIGGVLFLVSDLMLFKSMAKRPFRFTNVMGTYYGAQLMLAMGVFLPAYINI